MQPLKKEVGLVTDPSVHRALSPVRGCSLPSAVRLTAGDPPHFSTWSFQPAKAPKNLCNSFHHSNLSK